MSKFERGDRVKVTVEGEVVYHGAHRTIEVRTNGGSVVEVYTPSSPIANIVTIEKIAPPVEAFKPGDVLREIGGTTLVALGQEGYTYLNNRDPGEQFKYGEGVPLSHFTSKDFERVDIS